MTDQRRGGWRAILAVIYSGIRMQFSTASQFTFTCSDCGELHVGLPDLTYSAPVYWKPSSADAQSGRDWITTDLCAVGEDRFIRCVLRIPIQGTDAKLAWGIWVTQSQANFDLYADTFDGDPENVPELATFGYVANKLRGYPDTLGLHVLAHWERGGKRPWIELEASDHPLYRDWAEGISRQSAIQFAELAFHSGKKIN